MPMPPLEQLNCSRGAPMGRRNRCEMLPEEVGKVFLQHVPFVDDCYDRGGAYWGMPADLWRAYAEIEWMAGADVDVFEHFLRAPSREKAKAELAKLFPNIRFYR